VFNPLASVVLSLVHTDDYSRQKRRLVSVNEAKGLSTLVSETGDFVSVPGDFVSETGDFVARNDDFVSETGDFVSVSGDFVAISGYFVSERPKQAILFPETK